MTVPTAELVARLKRLSRLRTPEESQEFLEVVKEVGLRRDASALDDLLGVIDDSTEDRGTMTELWRVLEKVYEPSIFVPALLRMIEPMVQAAPESTFYLHARLLNDPDPTSFERYLAGLPALSPPACAALRKLLDEPFKAEFPERLARVKQALSAC